MAPLPDRDRTVIVNLFRGTCFDYSDLECYLLSVLPELPEDHPVIEHFAGRGIIVNFDEREKLAAMSRRDDSPLVILVICPTMACNFDCPYCFEKHPAGRMSREVQDDVTALARRILKTSGAERLHITWYGGEPLLAQDIIEDLSVRLRAVAEEFHAAYSSGIVTNGYLLTQKAADLLARSSVSFAQITLDGLGSVHDATRHLADGGPTFERITENLRHVKLPFDVSIRHNIYEGNRQETDALRAFVEKLAEESDNHLEYYCTLVSPNQTAEERGAQLEYLNAASSGEIGLAAAAEDFSGARGYGCAATNLYYIGIDEKGNLYKCGRDVDKEDRSFGRASGWDPADPIGTADHPDRLACYLDAAHGPHDPECHECVWLPHCRGGCPNSRIYSVRDCVPYKNEPGQYALAVYNCLKHTKQQNGRDNTH